MSRSRHSFVPFYMDDWAAATSHMPRLHWSILFQVCHFNWDKAEPVPPARMKIMLADLGGGEGEQIINLLVESGSLAVDERGIYSPRALREAQIAFDLWCKKSRGGKGGKGGDNSGRDSESLGGELEDSSNTPPKTPEHNHPIPEPEPSQEGGKESPPPPLPVGPAEVAQAWNDMAATCGLSHIKVMTDERQKRLGARIAEHGAQAIIGGIQQIPHIGFMLGDNDRGWKANFDFLLVPKNCTKLLEGGYAAGNGRRSGWVGD